MSKTTEPLISIIIPVYQVAPYLRECLNSIVRQNYSNWELLLVDDGSTDESGGICDEYASSDLRIAVFHQENFGIGAARNVGLDNMHGEYVSFVDADDVLLTTDYLRELLRTVEDNHSQISVCGSLSFPEFDPPPSPERLFDEDMNFSGGDILSDNGFAHIAYFPFACTARLFSRECFQNIRFPSGITSEDIAIAAALLLPVDRVSYSGCMMYGYRSRSTSVVHNRSAFEYYKDSICIQDMHRRHYLLHGEFDLAGTADGRKKYYQLRSLLLTRSEDEVDALPLLSRTSYSTVVRSYPRKHLWDMIIKIDPDHSSVCSKCFFEIELHRIRLVFALIKAFLNDSSLPPWQDIQADLNNIVSLALKEKLSVMVIETLCKYEHLPDSYRKLFADYESEYTTTPLRSEKGSGTYLADILDISINDLPHCSALYDKLLVSEGANIDFTDEEKSFLLRIVENNAHTT